MRCKTIGAFIVALLLLTPFAVSADTAPRADWAIDLGGNREEIFYDVIQTSDGGYAAAGMTRGMSNTEDVYVVKFSASGDVEWEQNYGGAKVDYAKSIIQTSDGGYMAAGQSWLNILDGNAYILKLDSSGDK